MDPESTGPEGAHALIALLRDHGVTVVVANNVDDAANAARPGTLLLFAQTQRVSTEGLLNEAGRRAGRSAAGRTDLACPRSARARYP